MFGLGGIFAEVLKDVTFRLAPGTASVAREMVEEIAGYPVLAGARGRPRADVDALVNNGSRRNTWIAGVPAPRSSHPLQVSCCARGGAAPFGTEDREPGDRPFGYDDRSRKEASRDYKASITPGQEAAVTGRDLRGTIRTLEDAVKERTASASRPRRPGDGTSPSAPRMRGASATCGSRERSTAAAYATCPCTHAQIRAAFLAHQLVAFVEVHRLDHPLDRGLLVRGQFERLAVLVDHGHQPGLAAAREKLEELGAFTAIFKQENEA